ncbi:hypothetical protein CASFOL_041396 [Castilleja foliolosa]|uniref:RanBP2-type domain-containing protein n=1 Tax=Castilleja foliolosa TaxID=1961234 RepID=A0ABD3BBK4_9LAMI
MAAGWWKGIDLHSWTGRHAHAAVDDPEEVARMVESCTNNNYASREKCKKCGQPKELAAMPAVAIPGASVPTHPTYFARAQGGMGQVLNVGTAQQSMCLSSSWPGGGTVQYRNQPTDPLGLQPASNWPLGDGGISGILYARYSNQFPPVANGNGWRTGDWMCNCGFHNYSSRAQ